MSDSDFIESVIGLKVLYVNFAFRHSLVKSFKRLTFKKLSLTRVIQFSYIRIIIAIKTQCDNRRATATYVSPTFISNEL